MTAEGSHIGQKQSGYSRKLLPIERRHIVAAAHSRSGDDELERPTTVQKPHKYLDFSLPLREITYREAISLYRACRSFADNST